jgi:hypothetical protein
LFLRGAGFSLRMVLARTNPRRLKPAPLGLRAVKIRAMARARKLFPVYGSALANNMLAALAARTRGPSLLGAYVADYGRRGILGGPARDRELAETMGREVLLAMIVEVHEVLPAFFGKKQKRKLKSEEKEAIGAFSSELMAALDRAQNWNGGGSTGSSGATSRCIRISTRGKELTAKHAKARKEPEEEAPFIARVALLLDPSCSSRPGARRANSTAPWVCWPGKFFGGR